MICKKCGSYNGDEQNYCSNCGESLAVSAEQPSQPYQPIETVPNNQYVQNQPAPQDPGRGMAIASLVLGIVSFLCFAVIAGPLAIVFGAIAKSSGSKSGMATAGIICGAIGLVLWIVMLIAGAAFSEYMYTYLY